MVLYSKHVTSICFKFFTRNIAVFAIIKKYIFMILQLKNKL